MQRPTLNRRRAAFSVYVASVTSTLALVFDPAWFLTLPGGLLTAALFGSIASMTNRPLRLGLNVVATSILLYSGGALLAWGNGGRGKPVPSATRVVFIVWLILLVPWMLVGPLSAMAFDGGATPEAYVYFWSTITYPASVALAGLLRRKYPYAVILPTLNFAACFTSSLLHQ